MTPPTAAKRAADGSRRDYPGRSGAAAPAGAGGGPRYWAHGYWRMLAWDLADLRLQLPILACVLILQGAGFVLGVGLLFHHMPEPAAAFVVTGIPVVNLITAGLIFEPQIVADQRAAGSYDFLQSMPVARGATAMAWYTVALITAVPAVVLTVVTGVARYHLHLTISPAIIPAVVAVRLTGVLMATPSPTRSQSQ
jgi:ABC-2 type transport system permease protein